jgi:NADH-quinone oxidoreductase subunit A
MSPYLPIIVIMVLGGALMAVMVGLSVVVGPRRWNQRKYQSYECGIDPTPPAVGGGRFPIKYYLIAMLFIIFDIETIFLYPWAVSFSQLGLFALIEMVLFMVTVFIAYLYVWRRGGLDWD